MTISQAEKYINICGSNRTEIKWKVISKKQKETYLSVFKTKLFLKRLNRFIKTEMGLVDRARNKAKHPNVIVHLIHFHVHSQRIFCHKEFFQYNPRRSQRQLKNVVQYNSPLCTAEDTVRTAVVIECVCVHRQK